MATTYKEDHKTQRDIETPSSVHGGVTWLIEEAKESDNLATGREICEEI